MNWLKLRQYKGTLKGTALTVSLPTDAQVLTFANQSGTIYCYALTMGLASESKRIFSCLKAPAEVPAGAIYITTIQISGRRHIFEPGE